MSAFLIVIAVIAVILLLVGGFVAAVKWLLWIGIVLALIAIIAWLARSIAGRRS